MKRGNFMLYQTSVRLTYEEYKRFAKTYVKKNLIKTLIGMLLVVLGAILFWIVEPFSTITMILTLFIILYPILLYCKLTKAIKKTYMSNELLKDIVETIEFYESHFISKTEKSEVTVKYEELYKILENKTNFYLMIADNQGYIVSKANCSQELIDFIISLKK